MTPREKELRQVRNFCIGFSIIVMVIALMTYANFFDTYFFDYFKQGVARENNWFMKFTHYLGLPSFVFAILFLWKATEFTWAERAWVYAVLALGFVILGIALAAGFNFDLHGIEPGV